MKKTIRLYTTAGCHLCEQAEAMVTYLLDNESSLKSLLQLELVEIANSEALMERYGVRIPVLMLESQAGPTELGWPFELSELNDWLASSKLA